MRTAPTPLDDLSPAERVIGDLIDVLREHGHHITQDEGEDGLAAAMHDAITRHYPERRPLVVRHGDYDLVLHPDHTVTWQDPRPYDLATEAAVREETER